MPYSQLMRRPCRRNSSSLHNRISRQSLRIDEFIKGEGESNGFDSPSPCLRCIDQLEQAGFEAWAVGGCVRDLLRGVQPHDYDLTTSALPEETLRLFPHTVPTGITYGTVTVIAQREPLEVTTFRTEEAYHDFRRPSGVLFASRLEQDLARRDFTVNAMAYAPSRGLTDLFGGA